MRLKGKTALITGGNSGIGLATARLFVAEGARVAITGRNRETLDAVASVWASEFAQLGIRVNVVSPGATRTPIWEAHAPTPEAYAKLDKAISATVPLGRMGEPEEIAKTVLFLASDDASYVHGQDLF